MPADDKKAIFRARWRKPLEDTFHTHWLLREDSERLRRLADAFYDSRARESGIDRWLKRFVNNSVCDWLTEAERTFWNDPLARKLFKLWQSNLGGWNEDGWRAQAKERTRFFDYLLGNYVRGHDPAYAEIRENYKNLAFSLAMLRPNQTVHIHIAYSFEQRPLPGLIRQYLQLAAITGQYDLLLRRLPPYHTLVHLPPAGQRTAFDSRGIDFRPITIPLGLTYTVALRLPKTQTRLRGRYIEIPVHQDENQEKLKQAEIRQREEEIKKIFPDPGYISKIDIHEDGKVYYRNGLSLEEVPYYGKRRAEYLQKEDYLKLFKAIPCPHPDSGLRVRFKLREPVAVLLDGLNRKRPLNLGELSWALKCVDLHSREARKPEAERRTADAIIDEVFSAGGEHGLSLEIQEFLDTLRRIRNQEGDETSAWNYVIQKVIEGRHQALVAAIYTCLRSDLLELVFSLWPLLTGQELHLEEGMGQDAGASSAMSQLRHKLSAEEQESLPDQLSTLPLLDILQENLQALLQEVFTRYVDISAATLHYNSESALARLVVEACLDTRNHRERRHSALKQLLQQHYTRNREFMGPLYASENMAEFSTENFYPAGPERLEQDLAGILAAIDKARARLFSRGQANRLLCFIDPASVEVLSGNFRYHGEALEREQRFFDNLLKRQTELADQRHKQKIEHEKELLEQEQHRKRMEQRQEMREAERKDTEEDYRVQQEIARKKAETLFAQLDLNAGEALSGGDFQKYALLALNKAHQGGGAAAVNKLLQDNPEVFILLDKDAFRDRETQKLKELVFKRLMADGSNPGAEVTMALMAALFGLDLKDALGVDAYKHINDVLAGAVGHSGLDAILAAAMQGKPRKDQGPAD